MNFEEYNALIANLANEVDKSDMKDLFSKFAQISLASKMDDKIIASLLLILTEMASRIKDLETRDNVTYH